VRGVTIDTRITLRKLEVFSSVVALEGFGRAAEQLCVAQPVVTAHVRSLEERLGVQLFYRDGRQMRLTEAGQAVYAWSEDVLRRTRELERDLTSLSDGARGRVALGASMSIGSYRLPPVLSQFGAEHPEADIRLSVLDSEHAIEDTRHGTLDFSVVVAPADDEIPGMTIELLGQDELILVATPGMVDSSHGLDVERLAQLPFIDAPAGTVRREFVDRQLRTWGVRDRSVVLQLGHPEAMKRATMEGLGVSLMFRGAVREELAQGRLEELRVGGGELWVPVVLVHRTGRDFSPLHAALIAAIRDAMAAPRGGATATPSSG
jgi:DNA-binding transcriptional LysR family regulator